jgi:hypothetical protein
MGLAGAAVLVLAGASAPPARAAVAFEATVQPSEISFLETRELSYRLRMTTGEREERFRVRVEQPRWDPLPTRGPDGFPVVPDCFRRPLGLEGVGRLANIVCIHGDPGPRSVCRRGSGFWELSGEVTLPPHSTSTLVARFLTSGPPLRRTDYRATFAVGGGEEDTLVGDQEIRPDAPRVRPPFGTHITLSTRPRTPYYPAVRRFRRGQAIDIRGRTERALHGQRMVLRYDYLPLRGRSRHRTLAPVRIDRRGRFRYRNWRPRRRGSYRLYALYRPRSASRVRDVSCSRGFALRG